MDLIEEAGKKLQELEAIPIEKDSFAIASDDEDVRNIIFPESMQTGFHDVSPGRKPKPNYQDMKKYFSQKGEYVVNTEERNLYRWNGKMWRPMLEVEVENFAQTNFYPPATTNMTKEFLNLIYRTNLQDIKFFLPVGKVNFNNGVYDIGTQSLIPHSSALGFRYCLPHDFDPAALCPRWEQYLNEVTRMDAHAQQQLEEFLAYTVFQCDPSWGQKALVLLGDGRRKGGNGKSVFISIAKRLVGEGAYSALSLKQLSMDVALGLLENKSLNVCEEIDAEKGFDSTNFKSIADGGSITVRKLYKGQFLVKPTAKMIFACNDLPKLKDDGGVMRRLLIVEFSRVFAEHEQDRNLVKKLTEEIPGIFNRLINSYKRLMQRGGFSILPDANKALEDYKQAQLGPIDLWIEDRLLADETGTINTLSCYNDFKTWYEVRGYHKNDMPHYNIFVRALKRSLNVDTTRKPTHNSSTVLGFRLSGLML
jgi:putative DNA primase/helicase